MPSERGAALADDFAAANADAIAFARSCNGRTSGLCPCRVKSGPSASSSTTSRKGTGRAALAAGDERGQGVTDTAEDIDRANAAHAAAAGSVGPAETIALLTERGPSSRHCCAGSTTMNWTGRRRSVRPGEQVFAAADLARWRRATPASTWPMPEARCAVRPDAARPRRRPSATPSVRVQGGADLVRRVGLRCPRASRCAPGARCPRRAPGASSGGTPGTRRRARSAGRRRRAAPPSGACPRRWSQSTSVPSTRSAMRPGAPPSPRT